YSKIFTLSLHDALPISRDVPTAEVHVARAGAHLTADDAKQGALARPVGADDGSPFARRNGEADAPQGLHAAESLVNARHPQHRVSPHGASAPAPETVPSCPTVPWGLPAQRP